MTDHVYYQMIIEPRASNLPAIARLQKLCQQAKSLGFNVRRVDVLPVDGGRPQRVHAITLPQFPEQQPDLLTRGLL